MDLKERIIEKASDLFRQYGIKNVSVYEIATSLGISKRTIYENFKDKEDILISVILHSVESKKKKFNLQFAQCQNVVEVFINIIEEHQNIPITNVKFFEDLEKYYPRALNLIKSQAETNKGYLRDFLLKGIREGYFREDLNVDVVAFLVEDNQNTYIRASYIENPLFSFHDLFFTSMINFVRGIMTGIGIRIIDDYLEQQKILKKRI